MLFNETRFCSYGKDCCFFFVISAERDSDKNFLKSRTRWLHYFDYVGQLKVIKRLTTYYKIPLSLTTTFAIKQQENWNHFFCAKRMNGTRFCKGLDRKMFTRNKNMNWKQLLISYHIRVLLVWYKNTQKFNNFPKCMN